MEPDFSRMFDSDLHRYASTAAGGAALGVIITVYVIIALIGIVLYIIQAYGLYKMAQRRGIEHAWLAYVPVAQYYIMGALLGNTEIKGIRFNPAFALPISTVAIPSVCVVLMFIPILGWIAIAAISVAYIVVYYILLYRLFQLYKPESAAMYVALSIIFSGIATPIIFFSLRKADLVTASGGAFEAPKNPFDN